MTQNHQNKKGSIVQVGMEANGFLNYSEPKQFHQSQDPDVPGRDNAVKSFLFSQAPASVTLSRHRNNRRHSRPNRTMRARKKQQHISRA